MNKDVYNLSKPQEAIWLTEEYFKGSNINRIRTLADFSTKTDNINFELLKKAINNVIKCNDAFQIRLFLDNGNVKQYFCDFEETNFPIYEISSLDDFINEDSQRQNVFSLLDSPLYEFRIFKLKGTNTGGILANFHHIICDALSTAICVRQIAEGYNALINDKELPNVNPDNFSYIQYLNSEKEYLNSEKFNKDKAYWSEVFETVPDTANIVSGKKSKNSINCTAARETYEIDKNLMEQINNFCKEKKISAYNFFMSIFGIYISKVSNLNDFVLGTPILNRINFREKNTFGMYISTIPFRIKLENELSFTDFVTNIAKDTMSIFRHQRYSYQYILEDLRKKEPNIPNLYNIMLSYQITKASDDACNYSTSWLFNNCANDSLDIHIFDINDENTTSIAYDYNLDKLDKEDITSIHPRILHIISQVMQNSEIMLKDISIVTPEEENRILNEFKHNFKAFDYSYNIFEQIKLGSANNLDNIAIETDDDSISYAELINRVNKLSNYLIENHIKPLSNIGIFTSRNIDTIIAILSIINIGCTYVPIDPTYPIDRINYMIDKSKVNSILTTNIDYENLVKCDSINFLNINYSFYSNYSDKFLYSSNMTKNDNLYIIFTSGSTGNPKGIILSQKNMLNLVFFEKNETKLFSKNNRILQFATMSFDVSYQEIFSALLTNSTLILVNETVRKDMDRLSEYILSKKVDTLFIPPAYLRILTENSTVRNRFKPHIKNIITAGEQLIITDGIRDLINSGIIINNHYGPAETHVASTYVIDKNNIQDKPPIGYPISNSYIYILDINKNLCPENVIGEIAISGDCVGNGYFANADLTNKKFVDGLCFNKRMYLTGDLGYMDKDHCIHYIGRSDFQVKINGFRIELEEVDKILMQHTAIKDAVSIIKEINNKKYIITYYSTNLDVNSAELLSYLKTKLPTYMIPTKLIKLPSIPINHNGKIDKKALPEVDLIENKNIYIAPSTETEQALVKIWEELFCVDKISIISNFFEIGGDSLLAIKLCSLVSSVFHTSITVEDIYKHPTIKELSKILSNKEDTQIATISVCDKRDFYPLSSAQKRIYYSSSLSGKNSILYNLPGGVFLDRTPDIDRLEMVFNKLISRHESFRTYFDLDQENIVQKVIDIDKCNFKLEVLSAKYEDFDKCFKDFVKPFDLSVAPLFRAKIVKFDNGKALLLFDAHHIIFDGMSLKIFIKELCDLYNDKTLSDINLTYKDFSVWENNKIDSGMMEDSKKYWSSLFKDSVPVLDITTSFPRTAEKSFDGAKIYRTIDKTTTEYIHNFANNFQVTPYMFLLSAYYILLSKYSMQDDIVVGSPIIGRDNTSLSNIIGMFVNTLPLRMKIDENCTFIEFLAQVKSMCLDSFKHQTYPFNEIVNDLNLPRNNNRSPLFDVLFTYQSNGLSNLSLGDIESQYYMPDTKIAKFDLSLEVNPINSSLSINFEYCTALFSKDFVSEFADHYLNILNGVLEKPNTKIKDILMLSSKEQKQILCDYNNTKANYPKDKTIIQLFEEQVKKTPKNTAIVFDGKKISYKKLNKKANRLANYLIQNGVNRKDVVAIIMNRSPEMIVALLAILKAGAAYLPIEPGYPMDRIQYILSDSKVSTILVHESTVNLPLANTYKKVEVSFNKDTFDNYSAKNIDYSTPEDLIYLIYTSGSTGKPKGVAVGHRSLVNYIYWASNFYCKNKPLNFPLYSSFSFDLTVTSIYTPLITGGAIVIYDGSDILITLRKIFSDGISNVIKLTPAHLSLVQDFDYSNTTIHKMIVGGDILPYEICKKIVNKCNNNMSIYNEYGPTEATVGCMIYEYSHEDNKYNSVPIGKPISNANIYVLDNNLHVLPFNCKGEIYIGGDCLSRGYSNPELNKNRFIQSPFDNTKLLYKTGDLAILHDNNVLEYIGRNDFQVKLNGYRIELKEIDKNLMAFPSIIDSLTTVYNNGSRSYLVSYFIADKKINTSDLSSYLHTKLTSYMVPTVYMQLDAFPITINGKIDKNALPKPILESKQAYVAPSTDLEKKLCNMWQDLFGIKKIGIDDNFFDLGGDSLTAIKFQVEALNQDLNISYPDIFANPTIRQLAKNSDTEHISAKVMQEYDYTKINDLLSFNDINNIPKKITNNKIKRVLLTGATGFLGAHILDNYLSTTSKGVIYCIVRKKNLIEPEERLRKILNFYFGEKYDKMFGNRIKVICADITSDNFGLDIHDYKDLSKKVDIVINSAAMVKHYGEYDKFYAINVLGTQKLIDFCKEYHKKLYHISTASISGLGLPENNYEQAKAVIYFSEKDLYKNQNIDNTYIETKFEAERLILENIETGLEACIFRMGNISNRYSDAKFQINVSENAFVNRIKSVLNLHVLQDGFKAHATEFAPVDLCADAIIRIVKSNPKFTVFHIFNNNLIPFNDIVKYLNELGVELNFVTDKEFSAKVNKFLKDSNLKNQIAGLATDLNNNKLLSINANILLNCDFTVFYLNKLGFNWAKIDKDYIKKYIEYFKKIKYFD